MNDKEKEAFRAWEEILAHYSSLDASGYERTMLDIILTGTAGTYY